MPILNRSAPLGALLTLALACTLTLAACDAADPGSSATATLPTASAAAKSDVCHYDADADTYTLINVADRALPAHVEHGDASPGEAVPTMPGFAFDEACVPVQDLACPCWDVTELDIISAEDQLTGSCVPFSTGTGIELFGIVEGSFVGFAALNGDPQFGNRYCEGNGTGVNSNITAEEADVCVQQLRDRCDEIGGPVLP